MSDGKDYSIKFKDLNEFEERIKKNFVQEQYQQGLDYLNGFKPNDVIDRYTSIFYSYRLKQLFEEKKVFKALRLIPNINRFNKTLLDKYPDSSSAFSAALVGRGEDLQYKPTILGGNLQKAEQYFLKSLINTPTTYEAYKLLLFYLNSKSDIEAAGIIIKRINKGEFGKEPILEDFLRAKITYQEGVRWYLLKKYKKAYDRLVTYLKLQPENYWGYYMLSQVEKELGLENKKNWQRAFLYGEKWNNKIFLDRMRQEEFQR